MDSNRISVKDNKITPADSTNETVEAGKVPCGAHTTNQPPTATPTPAPGGANRLTAPPTLLQPGPRGQRESAALSIFQKRTISRNVPLSPSERRRYTPRRQLQRSKTTMRKRGHSAYCQHRVLGVQEESDERGGDGR